MFFTPSTPAITPAYQVRCLCLTREHTISIESRNGTMTTGRIDRLEEIRVERGTVRRSSLKRRERAVVNQTNTGTVSKATLGKILRDGVERIWAFPSA